MCFPITFQNLRATVNSIRKRLLKRWIQLEKRLKSVDKKSTDSSGHREPASTPARATTKRQQKHHMGQIQPSEYIL